jgi:carboxyl-terminal processing protease
MTYRGHQPVIASVIPNSPAQQVGLKPGDALRQVDGKDVSEMPIERIITLVRGPAGSVVHLRLNREGNSQPLDFEITRARVEVPSVTWHLLPGTQIAHIVMEEFGASTHDQLQSILKEAKQAGARGLILDVRNNPGGYKDQAVAVTSMFLKDGNVFIEQDGQGQRTPVPVVPGGEATDIPLVVLINEETGSAAEIFAGAIKDHARGKLIGTQTVGTGTVLQPFELSDGSAVYLAVSQWLTPNGQSFWHEGIKPDIAVTLPEGVTPILPETATGMTAAELAKSEDKQLLEGLKVVQGQVK